MGVFPRVLILCLGILGSFTNVSCDDLDLRRPEDSGFTVNHSTKNRVTYTQISPEGAKSITRVLDGENTVWEPGEGETCFAVVLITSSSLTPSLIYIEIITQADFQVKYFSGTESGFQEIDDMEFDDRLIAMEDLVSLDEDPVEGPSGYAKEEVESQPEKEPEEEVTREFESTDVFLKKNKRSLRRVPDYECDPADRDCSHKKRVFDIIQPQDNERVLVDFEINDWVPVMSVVAKGRRKVTMVYENENLIWEGDTHERLALMTVHSFRGEYQLVELFYTKKKKTYPLYFAKSGQEWDKVDETVFRNIYKEMKAQIELEEEISINVSKVKNADLFFEKYEQSPVFDATTYFPLTGYLLTQVRDGNTVIWKSSTRRCIAAIVVKKSKQIMYLKLEILDEVDDLVCLFFKKDDTEYSEISEAYFEELINESDTIQVIKPIKIGCDDDDLVEQSDQEYSDNYKHEKKRGSMDSDEIQPVALELTDLGSNGVTEGEYERIIFKTFFPSQGHLFSSITNENAPVWQGAEGEVADLVRMFYPYGKPALGFLRLSGREKPDLYLAEESGAWYLISRVDFKSAFDTYSKAINDSWDYEKDAEVQKFTEHKYAQYPSLDQFKDPPDGQSLNPESQTEAKSGGESDTQTPTVEEHKDESKKGKYPKLSELHSGFQHAQTEPQPGHQPHQFHPHGQQAQQEFHPQPGQQPQFQQQPGHQSQHMESGWHAGYNVPPGQFNGQHGEQNHVNQHPFGSSGYWSPNNTGINQEPSPLSFFIFDINKEDEDMDEEG